MNFKIDKSKSINSMLYIIQKLKAMNITPDIHKVMKLMYFADRKHLVDYGHPITGDTYQKMKYGPVPSFANNVANDKIIGRQGFVVKDRYVLNPNKYPDMDDLSISEVKCLNYSIDKYSGFNFVELTNLSHDHAWNSSDWDIDYLLIAEEGGADENMLKYIREQILNSNLSFC